MENRDRLLGLLGLCRKAGKLVLGFDASVEEAKKGTAALLLTAADASEKTKKETVFFSAGGPVETLPHTMAEMEPIFKRRVAVMAVLDSGFAKRMRELIVEQ